MNLNTLSYIQCILVKVYTLFYASKGFLRDYLALDQLYRGYIWRSMTYKLPYSHDQGYMTIRKAIIKACISPLACSRK